MFALLGADVPPALSLFFAVLSQRLMMQDLANARDVCLFFVCSQAASGNPCGNLGVILAVTLSYTACAISQQFDMLSPVVLDVIPDLHPQFIHLRGRRSDASFAHRP